MKQLEQWQFDSIKDCLKMAKMDLLGQRYTDTPEELARKELQRQSYTTRFIDKCLKFFEK